MCPDTEKDDYCNFLLLFGFAAQNWTKKIIIFPFFSAVIMNIDIISG